MISCIHALVGRAGHSGTLLGDHVRAGMGRNRVRVLRQRVAKVLDLLTGDLAPGEARSIDNSGGAFMPVHVEHLQRTPLGSIYSVAHYYEQHGDLIADPDMTFLRTTAAEWIPLTYQDSFGYRRGVEVEPDGSVRIWPREHASQLRFAAMWMRNLRDQQGL